MIKALDAANFFVNLANDEHTEMTNLRVNKLLYFAQGWSLVRSGKPLFHEDIEAWDLGPVVPEVYRTFKPCGGNQIQDTSFDYNYESIPDDDLDLLLDVARFYKKYATSFLVNETHMPASPWKEVHIPHGNNVIPVDSLSRYFASIQPIDEFKLPIVQESSFVGYRDNSGVLVLPKELDDAR